MKKIITTIGLFLLAGLMLSHLSCKKTSLDKQDYFYNYFPTEIGHWIVWEVDSVYYNSSIKENYHYYIRETIKEDITDNEGRILQRVLREKKDDIDGEWCTIGVCTQIRTEGRAERVEENLKFVKLTFPVHQYKTWDGTLFIDYDDPWNCSYLHDWSFEYSKVDEPAKVNNIDFDSCLYVEQAADSGLICKNLSEEIYALNTGMVYKYIERLTTQDISPDPFHLKAESGYIVRYRISDWSR